MTPANQPPKSSSHPSVTIRAQLPDGKIQNFPVKTSKVRIGRAPDNDIVLDHDTVSRYHVQILVDGGQLYLEDLGSKNGTEVGGERLPSGKPRKISARDSILIGKVKVSIQGASPEVVSKSPPASVGRKVSPPAPGILRRFLPVIIVFSILGVIFLLVVVGFTLVNKETINTILTIGRGGRLTADCPSPPMVILNDGGRIKNPSALQTAMPSGLGAGEATPEAGTGDLLTTAFLELPFPYDGSNESFGGNDEQFRLAVQRNTGTGGRVNSFFDHFLPIYPAPADPSSPGGKEPAEPPVGKNIVPFDGLIDPYISYSGHPGIDFSTFVYRQPTTPVFAAADGIIAAVGTHGASGALYVKINHTVQGLGAFQTIYWHLNPDTYFDAMLGHEGEPIQAGTRVGTMGNTGFSTGHHLHFEVRFDLNRDGIFSGSEVIDPFGWTPSTEFTDDPWFERSGIVSNYLWVHPLGASALIPVDGGGQIVQPGDTGGAYPVSGCAKPGALPPGGTLFYSWAPDPAPNTTTTGVGQGCVLSVLDAQGNPVSLFDDKVKVVLPFNQADLSAIDPETLTIYWQAPGDDTWTPLDTTLDLENKVAIAETDRPGKCSLMGKPTKDKLPPQTEILLSGEQAADGSFYDKVQVTLQSKDPSGIADIFYSLDNGSTWLPYSSPFTIEPGAIPQLVEFAGDLFGGLPGTYLVLASAVDKEGNVENPAAQASFSINPTKNPEYSPLTDLLIPTQAATATPPVDLGSLPPPPDPVDPVFGATLPCLGNMALTWTGVADTDGIKEYQWSIEEFKPDTQTYVPIAGGSTSGTWVNVALGCGYFRYAVRTVDGAGNVGAYSNYVEFHLVPIDEFQLPNQ